MARRVLAGLLFVGLLGAVATAEQSEVAQGQQGEAAARKAADVTLPITFGRSVVPLYGPWKFRVGDSPVDPRTGQYVWAEPGFDDSRWESVSLEPEPGMADPFDGDSRYVPGWTKKGHAGYWGYAWYRMRVEVKPGADGKLALNTFGWVDGAYQLYVNGRLVGSWGVFREGKRPITYFTQPAMFALPQSWNDGAGDASPHVETLAFRFWMGPLRLAQWPMAGGLHYAPLLGDAGPIQEMSHLEWLELFHKYGLEVVGVGLFLLLAIVAASLTLFDLSDSVYWWVAGSMVPVGLIDLSYLIGAWTQLESMRTFFFLAFVILNPIWLGSSAMMWRVWFHERRPLWAPRAIAALAVLYALFQLLGGHLIYALIPGAAQEVFHAASLVVRVLLLAMIGVTVGRGIRREGPEGWFVLPAVAGLAVAQFESELISMHLPGVFSIKGMVIFMSEVANLVLIVTLALLLLRRLVVSVHEQRKMALDVRQAQEVQQVMLPEARIQVAGFAVESEYRPAREVGGDFFQVIPHTSGGGLLIVVGDVMGKGLKAGMLVALLVGVIRSKARTGAEPLALLRELNLSLMGRGDAYATCLALQIEPDGSVTLANAGHLAPFLNGEPVEMEAALPLGIEVEAEFTVTRFWLQEGDRLILISDGVADAIDANGALFDDFGRICEMLRAACSAADLAAAAQKFGQEDDISVVSVTRTFASAA